MIYDLCVLSIYIYSHYIFYEIKWGDDVKVMDRPIIFNGKYLYIKRKSFTSKFKHFITINMLQKCTIKIWSNTEYTEYSILGNVDHQIAGINLYLLQIIAI